jgi:hypothetical protein
MKVERVIDAMRRLLAGFGRDSADTKHVSFGRRRFFGIRKDEPACAMSAQGRAALLVRACVCIRLKQPEEAQAILNGPGFDESDAARLNLLGILCELRGQWRAARRSYGRAIRADGSFAPPQQNIRRLYELCTFGRSGVPPALGDEDPQVWAQREQFVRRLHVNARRSLEAQHHHDN